MAAVVRRARVTAAPLDVAALAAEVVAAVDGAVVTFSGVVRDHDGGRPVVRLDYEAHPDAERVLRRILARVVAEPPGADGPGTDGTDVAGCRGATGASGHVGPRWDAGSRGDAGASAVSVAHRVGSLRVGEVAFAVAVAAPHRAAAFALAATVVDAVKAGLPVWKRQFFADGTDEFVGLPRG